MIEWRYPWILIWLLPAVAFWVGCFAFGSYRNSLARTKFLQTPMADRLMSRMSWIRTILKATMQFIAVAALILALAGPQFGDRMEEVQPKGNELYILLDVSRSMLAADVIPTRLDRAKADITSLVNSLTGERIGLIAFAGQAVVQCPLTVDYDYFRRTLAGTSTDSAPRGGTAIGDSIRKALQVFSADSQRNQAILLITDGDDHSSAPLEAAAYAAERNVKVFVVGLGDTAQGARIPDRSGASQFMEHNGEQVWSKLDGSLLEQVAKQTSGVYVPVGTRSYDLSEIYSRYLSALENGQAEKETRIRRADQYQWFLAISILFFLMDLLVRPYVSHPKIEESIAESKDVPSVSSQPTLSPKTLVLAVSLLTTVFPSLGGMYSLLMADDADKEMRSGIDLYQQSKFTEASQAFASANESLLEEKDELSYLASFDQACAEHRAGDLEKAVECYLQAAMTRDRKLSSFSHFNLGNLYIEQAKQLTQDQIQPPSDEQREEILSFVEKAIAAYRYAVELDSGSTQARRNIEIVRQWLKATTDLWRKLDLMKQRQEMDLVKFLEMITATQRQVFDESAELKDLYSFDRYAELKLLQDELVEELPYLKQKIRDALSKRTDNTAPGNTSLDNSSLNSSPSTEEIQQAIKVLNSWVDTAGSQMKVASHGLEEYRSSKSCPAQTVAISELDKVWNAVVPFLPTVQRCLQEQSTLVQESERIEDLESSQEDSESEPAELTQKVMDKWLEQQQQTLTRARSIEPKARAEMEQLSPSIISPDADAPLVLKDDKSLSTIPTDSDDSKSVDDPTDARDRIAPDQAELIKGLEKAIELSPIAVKEMEAAWEAMTGKRFLEAERHATEARRLLKEILESQPTPREEKQEEKQEDQNQDQQSEEKNNSGQKNENQQPQQQHNGEEENDQDQRQSKQSDQQQSDRSQLDKDSTRQKKTDPNGSQEPRDSESNTEERQSQDRIAEAFRKVREREAIKREWDRKFRATISGQVIVEKDW